jgi:hypothetical protein
MNILWYTHRTRYGHYVIKTRLGFAWLRQDGRLRYVAFLGRVLWEAA